MLISEFQLIFIFCSSPTEFDIIFICVSRYKNFSRFLEYNSFNIISVDNFLQLLINYNIYKNFNFST